MKCNICGKDIVAGMVAIGHLDGVAHVPCYEDAMVKADENALYAEFPEIRESSLDMMDEETLQKLRTMPKDSIIATARVDSEISLFNSGRLYYRDNPRDMEDLAGCMDTECFHALYQNKKRINATLVKKLSIVF